MRPRKAPWPARLDWQEPQRCEDEGQDRDHPPRRRPPGADARPQSQRKCHRRPEQRLPRRVPIVCHGRDFRARTWVSPSGGWSDSNKTAGDHAEDEQGPGTRVARTGALGQTPVFQEELGDVKVVSARAASPIRCETSAETDRISVLPQCDSRLPGGGLDPWPASPDHTKHIGQQALRVPPES